MGKLLASLSMRQKVTIVVAALLVAAGLSAFVHWRREADFKPLFTGMAAEDAGAVVRKLKEGGVPYRLSEDGSTVLVPSDRQAEWRLGMAAAGLPKSGRIGFELFDKTNFGATEFTEHINYRRALEGELERSVMALAEVEQARVHLTFPKDSVFVEARQPAKGSVMVKLRPGMRLEPQNVLAVCHLVSSAVEGLAPEAVSVLDMRGNLLSRARKPASLDIPEPSEAALDYRRRIESDLAAKINSTLEPLLGADKFRAGASVDCDFSSGEQSEESFDPTHSVMATSMKTEDVSGTTAAAGVPGTASTLPRPTSRPSGSQGGLTRRTENITFQTSRSTRHLRLAQGTVKKLSISILVDHGVQWEGQGAKARRVLVPPSPEKLKSIRELVAAATGFSAERGDQLVVEALPFESTMNAEPPPPPAAPGAVPQQGKRPTNWMEQLLADRKLLIGVASGAGVVLLLLIGVVIMLVRRGGRKAAASMPAALPANAERKAIAAVAPADDPNSVDRQMEAKLAERESMQRQLEAEALNSLKMTPVVTKKTEVLAKHLRENVKKEPNLSAQVLLSWLREEEP